MHNTSNTYSVDHVESSMLNEPAMAYAKQAQSDKRKVNTQELKNEGFMTLNQSKALIEKKIHNHFHS